MENFAKSSGADTLTRYYENAFSSSEDGNIYKPFSLLDRLSHTRKMELLAELPLPDLSRAVVVDYGVGSWGFGCVYPRLKECRKAIGIDISKAAIRLSQERSQKDPALKHAELEFLTSVGYNIPLPDQSVDIVFAGECLEHIEETDAFLGEIHRVLKVGGIAIFTTPNRLPYVYRNIGLEWCLGYEHVALMDAPEFLSYLGKYFGIITTKGFNQTLHPAVDQNLDEATASRWVNSCEDDMINATGMIAMVRKEADRTYPAPEIRTVEYQQVSVTDGKFRDVPLVEQFCGRMIRTGSTMGISAPKRAERVHLIFWAHPWSGIAEIYADDRKIGDVDLYSHVGGCRRVTFELRQPQVLTVVPTGTNRAASHGSEVIFVRAVFAGKEE